MGQTQPFEDLEPNLPEAESASVIETRYLVILGTFTSLQKSDFLTEGLETNRAGKAILSTIQNPPLLAIACFLMVLGSVMISWLS
ncbi:uncharacterized protein NFIA_080450 [Aspergillus fischeri NRRL 181]|uniref:Uncharacterized protein n=1 Tax=Neosartorya fischeri (strain ATCC 1020 / DSM 3700 / CBS 544.65 / FGSC A1164 / JCM 1740 / NRRL 181 / WB 181) TaxID=331117 RepID=A1DFE4_NEOFI|nr:uncharacterized protein NFIA_080450 [Aspergillus fischeri NRRL 181]EAW18101.1 hypothetical protein NFIA_080450 [Aspergillus fischeri NRRL 181]